MDIYLISGLFSLAIMFVFLMFSDVDIPLGEELHVSIQGILLGFTFLSFTNYYIQNYTNSVLMLTISGILFFILGYYVSIKLLSFIRSGESGFVPSNYMLLYKTGKITNYFEKNNDFLYEIIIDNETFIAKANNQLDREKDIVVIDISQNKEIIIANSDLN